MRSFGKWLGRLLLALVVAGSALWTFGPYENADLSASFDPAAFGGDLDAYFAAAEAQVQGITPGTEKRVIWAGAPGARTPLSVVYIHGFSATSEEIRPVPDRVAQALGANLVFTRLTGHGVPGEAMGRATVPEWMADTAEAIAAGRVAGDRVVLITTSTGGTLAAAAAHDPALMEGVAGIVFVSPNFAVNSALAPLLTLPAARYWLPRVAGESRAWTPLNDAQARFWTTEYPSVSVLPMAALVKAVAALDPARATVPALFYFSPQDQIVRPDVTAKVAVAWGGPATVIAVSTGPGDDPASHVIAGNIVSPGLTDRAVATITDWIAALP